MTDSHSEDPLHIYPDAQSLCQACAEHICRRIAQGDQQPFHLALSGGSTPRSLYQRLATAPYRETLTGNPVHFWFGDERAVPPDHPDSNYRMARETLFEPLGIPAERIHPMRPLPEDMSGAASAYEQALEQCLDKNDRGLPRFDLVLLGLGPDGHTASLFPDTDALEEQHHWVTPVYVDKLASWRLSLSFPVLEAARERLFLVAGAGKSGVIRQLFTEHRPLPAGRLLPLPDTFWFLDQAAARELSS